MKYARGTFICTLSSTFFTFIVLMVFSGFDKEIKLSWDTVFIILFITNCISIITLVIHESDPSGTQNKRR